MRHIPEDELHAYLDQALSRSQCVEIESHLAHCPACRQERDGIAALRDRTTAVLAQLAPPLRRPPSWSTLEAEARRRAATRRHRVVRLGWAASLAAAVGLGCRSCRGRSSRIRGGRGGRLRRRRGGSRRGLALRRLVFGNDSPDGGENLLHRRFVLRFRLAAHASPAIEGPNIPVSTADRLPRQTGLVTLDSRKAKIFC